MKVKGLLCVLMAVSTACSREKKDTANIVFEIPPIQQKAGDFNLLDLADTADDFKTDDNWSSIVPTGITTGDFPINCYAVMVSGPDPVFRESVCGRSTTTTISGTTATQSGMAPMFYFGPWVGAVYAGAGQTARIEMDIPAGSDRVFRLIGFHALSAAACTDFKTQAMNTSELTKPHILGIADRVNLSPGETSTITIPQALNSNEWFDKCEFRGIADNPVEAKAEMIGIKKVSGKSEFGMDTIMLPGSNYRCELYKFYLMDKYYRPSSIDKNVNVGAYSCNQQNADPICDLNTVKPTFATFNDCESAGGVGPLSFVLSSSKQYEYRWVRTEKYGSVADRVHNMYLQARGTFDSSVEMQRAEPTKFLLRQGSERFVKLYGPKNLIAGRCYKYTAKHMGYSGSYHTSGGLDLLNVIVDSVFGPLDISSTHVFSDSACSTSVGGLPSSTWGVFEFYIRAPINPKATIKVSASDGLNADDADIVVTSKAGSSTLKYARFSGPQALEVNQCVGPFSLESLNENGSTMLQPVLTSTTFKLTHSSPISVYPNVSCTTAIDMQNVGLTIAPSASDVKFYMMTSGSDGQLNYNFSFGENLRLDVDMIVFGNP